MNIWKNKLLLGAGNWSISGVLKFQLDNMKIEKHPTSFTNFSQPHMYFQSKIDEIQLNRQYFNQKRKCFWIL